MGAARGVDSTHPRHFWFHAIVGVVPRPWLWRVAVRQLARLAPSGWWRRAPFLPIPDAAYVAFRLDTAYGRSGRPRAHDVVAYLQWCRGRRS